MNPKICIVGVSSSNKTEIAFKLAQKLKDAIVICGDKYQTVKKFSRSTGAEDYKNYDKDIKSYLYQFMNNKRLSLKRYLKEVSKINKMNNGYGVFDGMSVTYLKEYIKEEPIVIGIRFKNDNQMYKYMSIRFDKEIEGIIKQGRFQIKNKEIVKERKSLVMSVVQKVIKKEIGINKAKNIIISRAIEIANEKQIIFDKIKIIKWFEVENIDRMVLKIYTYVMEISNES